MWPADNREVVRRFILAYKEMPNLWDKKNKDYHNKKMRNDDFRKLAKILKEVDKDASVFCVRRKIDNLRNVYVKELKKVRASQLTATKVKDIYKPRLWHYKLMSFLEQVVEPQAGLPVLDEGEIEEPSGVEVKAEDPLDSDSSDHYATDRTKNMDDTDNREVIRRLIHAYRDMRHMWDKKHKDYHNKKLRHQDFKKLAKILQETEEGATIFSVKKKLGNLRSVYVKELKKVKTSQLAAVDPEDVYMPTLWHYRDMSFLENVVEPQGSLVVSEDDAKDESKVEIKAEDTKDSDSDDHYLSVEMKDMEDDGSSNSESDSYNQPGTSSRKESQNNDGSENEAMIIAKYIDAQLRDVKKKQKTIALKLISDAIYFANLGKLRESSCVQL